MNFIKVGNHLINLDDVSGFSLKTRSPHDNSQLYNFKPTTNPFDPSLYELKSNGHPTFAYIALVVTYKNYSNDTILMTAASEDTLNDMKSTWDNINNYIKLSLVEGIS